MEREKRTNDQLLCWRWRKQIADVRLERLERGEAAQE
jgi:hypothetical protein